MLNSAEHEICPANKSQFIYNCKFHLANIDEHEIFSANNYENANYPEKISCSAELSMKKVLKPLGQGLPCPLTDFFSSYIFSNIDIILISPQKHMLWVFIRKASVKHF